MTIPPCTHDRTICQQTSSTVDLDSFIQSVGDTLLGSLEELPLLRFVPKGGLVETLQVHAKSEIANASTKAT